MVGRGSLHQGRGRGHVQLHGIAAPRVGADLRKQEDNTYIEARVQWSESDLGVAGAPAAPDQRAQVLEAEDRPPVESEVTHADQGHAHQVQQVKLKWEKLVSILVNFRDRR